jgi:fructosamine-3-kinase
VIGVVETAEYQALLLSFVEPSNTSRQFWETFGIQLAQLHEKSQPRFGLDHDNYIGSLHQRNQPHDYWPEFFIEERLCVQLTLATSNGVSSSLVKKFEVLFKQLPSLLPVEKPSLLHGDLWRGNLITETRLPCLIDPAVYFGHREVDLAMTQLFGGFDPIFLESYQGVFPLEKGWRDRLDLYNLYPLLVHLNLFGRSYEAKILNILKTFA